MKSCFNSANNNKSSSKMIISDSRGIKMMPTNRVRVGLGSRNFIFLCICVLLTFCFVLDTALCDYENTWNFYYEQPCCGNPTGFSSHHVRHHRGEFKKIYSIQASFIILVEQNRGLFSIGILRAFPNFLQVMSKGLLPFSKESPATLRVFSDP